MNDAAQLAGAIAPYADFAARIAEAWHKNVAAVFEIGRLLIEAKAALPHGAFGAMIETALPFSRQTAHKLMTIAADDWLTNVAHVPHLPASWGTLYELTKVSAAQRDDMFARGVIRPDLERLEVVTNARAVMGSRIEPDDSLDYFPTPPWATRALIERVLPACGVTSGELGVVWEPACGEGHIAGVLTEYSRTVIASDVFDYGYGDVIDFLDAAAVDGFLRYEGAEPLIDFIVTNPPFEEKATAFIERALALAPNVAMFLPLRYLEGRGRYERIFARTPPVCVAIFVERVPLHRGRWEPEGDTATAYCWLVWLSDVAPRAPLWIPPGCREQLTRPDDAERFTAHPVIKRGRR